MTRLCPMARGNMALLAIVCAILSGSEAHSLSARYRRQAEVSPPITTDQPMPYMETTESSAWLSPTLPETPVSTVETNPATPVSVIETNPATPVSVIDTQITENTPLTSPDPHLLPTDSAIPAITNEPIIVSAADPNTQGVQSVGTLQTAPQTKAPLRPLKLLKSERRQHIDELRRLAGLCEDISGGTNGQPCSPVPNGSILGFYANRTIIPEDALRAGAVSETITVQGARVMAWNGFPKKLGWGKDLEFQVTAQAAGTYRADTYLGGVPCFVLWTEKGGAAMCNAENAFNPNFGVTVKYSSTSVSVQGFGGRNMVAINFIGDYYDALRIFTKMMAKSYNIMPMPSPAWAYNPIWETYGKEESFTKQYVYDMMPVLKDLGISTITLDSGWYGKGSGSNWNAMTGDYPVNPDVIGSEKDMIDFVTRMKDGGFRVRLWWVPGVAEEGTKAASNKGWMLDPVLSSTGDTGDVYLDARRADVRLHTKKVVERLIGTYGADGFKQDDVYQMRGNDQSLQAAYSQLFRDILSTARTIRSDAVVNTCNCGVAQNFYDMPGQNQMITSDPLGAKQYRLRAKYMKAIALEPTAILADHIELMDENDPGPSDLSSANYYKKFGNYEFASVIALGLVPEAKFNRDPRKDTDRYKFWFNLYNKYQFGRMQWLNVPYVSWGGFETYCLRDARGTTYYSFFHKDKTGRVDTTASLGYLQPGVTYTVTDMIKQASAGQVKAPILNFQLKFTGIAFYSFTRV